VPHTVLALLLIGPPGIVVIVGCAMALRIWRKDQTLREMRDPRSPSCAGGWTPSY
jgi:hypothetical protein